MALTIGRSFNVIINQGGIAHTPGYVFIKETASSIGKLFKGKGWYNGSFFQYKTDGAALFEGGRDELTLARFHELTGWLAPKVRAYPAKYAHSQGDTPGSMTVIAGTDEEAIAEARKFVEKGFRNGTWITVDIADGFYTAQNEHGSAVGKLTK